MIHMIHRVSEAMKKLFRVCFTRIRSVVHTLVNVKIPVLLVLAFIGLWFVYSLFVGYAYSSFVETNTKALVVVTTSEEIDGVGIWQSSFNAEVSEFNATLNFFDHIDMSNVGLYPVYICVTRGSQSNEVELRPNDRYVWTMQENDVQLHIQGTAGNCK